MTDTNTARPEAIWTDNTDIITEVPTMEVLQQRWRDASALYEEQLRKSEQQASRIRDLERSIGYFESDIDAIGERMLEEARDHDYCSTYDQAVEALNARMQGGHLLPTRNWRGELQFLVTVSVDYSGDESEARDGVYSYLMNSIDDIDQSEFDSFSVTTVRSQD